MVRAFPRVAVFLVACLLLMAGVARADTLTLQNGGTVTGSFIYDMTTNSVISFNFTTTAGGGFGNESYIGPVLGSGAVVVSNQDGDQVFSFDSVQSDGTVDELDIVLSCGGVLNCAQLAAPNSSFAVTTGFPPCPNPGGKCIASGLQNQVPGGVIPEDLISAGNFITVTDPTCPGTDTCFTMTLSTTSTGTVFNGGGGTGNNNVPEPSTLLLSALGLGALALKRFYA
jgi:hypothetical protein